MRIDHPRSQEEAIVMEVREPVRRFLSRILHDPAMVDDAQSDTLLTVIQRLRGGLVIRRPVSFALQVAWTKALDVQRRDQRRDQSRPLPRVTPDPARMAELRDWLESGLAALRPIERAVLHLRYTEDMSYREIARVLGEPVGTIGRQLHDARKSLRGSLERTGGGRVTEAMLGALLPMMRAIDGLAAVTRAHALGSSALAARAAARATAAFRMLACLIVVMLGAGTWTLLLPDEGSRNAPIRRTGLAAAGGDSGRDASNDSARANDGAGPAPELAVAGNPAGALASGSAETITIAGVVMDLEESPVADATITYHAHLGHAPVRASTKSGRDGRYRLEALPIDALLARPDAGVLVVESPRHAPQIRPVGLGVPGARPGSVDLDVWLTRGSVLEGVVRDAATGLPIAGATVEVWMNAELEAPGRPGHRVPRLDPIEPQRLQQTTTDEAGRYRLERMPVRIAGIEPGCRFAPFVNHERPVLAGGIVASAPGRIDAGALVPLATEDGAIVAVDVTLRPERAGDEPEGAGECAPDPELIRGRPAAPGDLGRTDSRPAGAGNARVLRGVVRSGDGRTVAGALVTAFRDSRPTFEGEPEGVVSETVSGASGAFEVRFLPPDPVRLCVGVPWPRNDGLIGQMLGRRFAVVVPEPKDPGPCVVTLPAYTAERGGLYARVVDAERGAPIVHDLVGSLVAADGTIGGHGMFVGPGRLAFLGVPAGTYSLVVEARGRPRVTTAGIRIAESASPEVRVRLARGPRLAGRVTWEGVLPPGTIYVWTKRADSAAARHRCASDGRFDLDGLAPGQWRLWAQLEEPGRPPAMVSRPRDVPVEAGAAAPPLELRLLVVAGVKVRLAGAFSEGDPPTTDQTSPRYGDLLRKLKEFRVRCRGDDGVSWFDTTASEIPFGVEGRDLDVCLPLPEGVYHVAIDHHEDELGSLRISSPGTGSLAVP
jgi:RNA polymerase sigma-70 factor (ECF subfamily)